MRGRILWLASVLTAAIALAPAPAHGQGAEFPRPDVELPVPIGHDRMDKGGLFLIGEYVMFKENTPIKHQALAFRGFVETSGGQIGISGIPGQFLGSHALALDAADASGPSTYQPGFKVGGGWRFENGATLEVTYMNLQKAVYNATATLAPPGLQVGVNQFDTFLFSPVFNFPIEFIGPLQKVAINPVFPFNIAGTVVGIWNGASLESIEFDQRASQIEASLRVPMHETECWRIYGLVGPRFFWVWERFKWRTVSTNLEGEASPFDVGIYTNIVSNRMYGAHVGIGQEWYLGHGFAVNCDVEGALFLDIIKERAKYELGEKDAAPQNKRSITDYRIVPEPEVRFNLMWYPHEAIELRVGYDAMLFFNTKASKTPVDFNWGQVAPPWSEYTRFFHGFNAGVAIIF